MSYRERKMYSAVCSDCGKDCEVPFQPDPSRPVYCQECWAKRRPPRRYRYQFPDTETILQYKPVARFLDIHGSTKTGWCDNFSSSVSEARQNWTAAARCAPTEFAVNKYYSTISFRSAYLYLPRTNIL